MQYFPSKLIVLLVVLLSPLSGEESSNKQLEVLIQSVESHPIRSVRLSVCYEYPRTKTHGAAPPESIKWFFDRRLTFSSEYSHKLLRELQSNMEVTPVKIESSPRGEWNLALIFQGVWQQSVIEIYFDETLSIMRLENKDYALSESFKVWIKEEIIEPFNNLPRVRQ